MGIVDRRELPTWVRRGTALVMLAALALGAGCNDVPPPSFRLNLQNLDPDDFNTTGRERSEIYNELRSAGTSVDPKVVEERYQRTMGDKQRRADTLKYISSALYAMFGTPDDPHVFPESGLDLTKIRLSSGAVNGDPAAVQRGLYRQHCSHCHGTTGDGAGPTAAFLFPYPRDYRPGIFKFKSTERPAKPTHADLKRVLLDGVAGTAMPSFALLPDAEVESLTEYVKYLSMRGEVEALLRFLLLEQEEDLFTSREELVAQVLTPVAATWQEAESAVIAPPDRPEVTDREAWLAAGAELFRGGKAQCMKCHGPTALGDGSEERLYDDWNKEKRDDLKMAELHAQIAEARQAPAAERDARLRDLNRLLRLEATWDLPPQQLDPRNLRLGIYRGGRRPVDLYRRIHAGINGTPMPAAGPPTPGAAPVLQPEEIWQLVDYVLSLPYERFQVTPTGDHAHLTQHHE